MSSILRYVLVPTAQRCLLSSQMVPYEDGNIERPCSNFDTSSLSGHLLSYTTPNLFPGRKPRDSAAQRMVTDSSLGLRSFTVSAQQDVLFDTYELPSWPVEFYTNSVPREWSQAEQSDCLPRAPTVHNFRESLSTTASSEALFALPQIVTPQSCTALQRDADRRGILPQASPATLVMK